MKKTLIALALTALPVAAMAEVTLYGTIKGGLEWSKAKGSGNTTITNVNDWGSSIGFKGEEELGTGLKAIWQIEQSVSLDNVSSDNNKFANKDSFIGLQSSFGTLKAGHVSDQFNANMDTLDPWQGNGITTLGGTFGRTSDRYTGVVYETPEVAGFSANILYSPEDNQRADEAREDLAILSEASLGNLTYLTPVLNQVSHNGAVTAVGLNYENSGFYVKYGFKMVRDSAGDKDGQVHRIEGGYDANNLFVGLGYQYVKNLEVYKETNEFAGTVAYTIGNVTPRLTYAHGMKAKGYDGNNVDNSTYDQVIVGADYALSKRTTALAALGWIKNGNAVGFNQVDFLGKGEIGGGAPAATGKASNQAYSVGVGLKHVF